MPDSAILNWRGQIATLAERPNEISKPLAYSVKEQHANQCNEPSVCQTKFSIVEGNRGNNQADVAFDQLCFSQQPNVCFKEI